MSIFVPSNLQYDSWVVLLMIVSFVCMSLTIGSDFPQVGKSVRSMFNFNNRDGQLVYAPLSLFGLLLAVIHTALSAGVFIYTLKGSGVDGFSETPARSVLSLSVVIVLFVVLKLLLYISVNGIICRRYYMSSQHFRWASFYIMVISILGTVLLALSVMEIYLNLNVIVASVLAAVVAILLEIGTLFKLFTAFFKKKCSVLVFFIYLCALEIAPCFLAWFLVK